MHDVQGVKRPIRNLSTSANPGGISFQDFVKLKQMNQATMVPGNDHTSHVPPPAVPFPPKSGYSSDLIQKLGLVPNTPNEVVEQAASVILSKVSPDILSKIAPEIGPGTPQEQLIKTAPSIVERLPLNILAQVLPARQKPNAEPSIQTIVPGPIPDGILKMLLAVRAGQVPQNTLSNPVPDQSARMSDVLTNSGFPPGVNLQPQNVSPIGSVGPSIGDSTVQPGVSFQTGPQCVDIPFNLQQHALLAHASANSLASGNAVTMTPQSNPASAQVEIDPKKPNFMTWLQQQQASLGQANVVPGLQCNALFGQISALAPGNVETATPQTNQAPTQVESNPMVLDIMALVQQQASLAQEKAKVTSGLQGTAPLNHASAKSLSLGSTEMMTPQTNLTPTQDESNPVVPDIMALVQQQASLAQANAKSDQHIPGVSHNLQSSVPRWSHAPIPGVPQMPIPGVPQLQIPGVPQTHIPGVPHVSFGIPQSVPGVPQSNQPVSDHVPQPSIPGVPTTPTTQQNHMQQNNQVQDRKNVGSDKVIIEVKPNNSIAPEIFLSVGSPKGLISGENKILSRPEGQCIKDGSERSRNTEPGVPEQKSEFNFVDFASFQC